jgi:excisionase family DNA binding protein
LLKRLPRWEHKDIMDNSLETLRLLTLPQAAALLHVSVRTLHRMIHKQELPAFKVGGQWRLRESQLTEWIERQQFATAPKGERVAWRDQADDAER